VVHSTFCLCSLSSAKLKDGNKKAPTSVSALIIPLLFISN
jgi:hypothetical protein